MIRICLLIPTLDRSGAEKQLTLLAQGLPRDEFDVHVIALTRGGPFEAELRDAGISVTVIGKRFRFDPLALWKLRRKLKQLQPQVLHSWLFAANAYARILSDNVIVSERCVDSWKASWQLWLDRRQIPRTRQLLGNSQSVADFYRGLGVPEDRLTVIPNGIRIPAERAQRRDEVLSQFDIPVGSRVVCYAGRLARQKRVRDLVWAMQLLRQLTENVHFLILGDGPERERCIEHARHYACDHLIRFAGHREDASEMLAHADVFWLASDFEGMSNSLMEAMAAGVPAVVSDIPPNRELVVDGTTGFVVGVGDSVGFSQFTDRILADAELAARLSRASVQRMRDHFSVESMVNAHADLYRNFANSPSEDRSAVNDVSS